MHSRGKDNNNNDNNNNNNNNNDNNNNNNNKSDRIAARKTPQPLLLRQNFRGQGHPAKIKGQTGPKT